MTEKRRGGPGQPDTSISSSHRSSQDSGAYSDAVEHLENQLSDRLSGLEAGIKALTQNVVECLDGIRSLQHTGKSCGNNVEHRLDDVNGTRHGDKMHDHDIIHRAPSVQVSSLQLPGLPAQPPTRQWEKRGSTMNHSLKKAMGGLSSPGAHTLSWASQPKSRPQSAVVVGDREEGIKTRKSREMKPLVAGDSATGSGSLPSLSLQQPRNGSLQSMFSAASGRVSDYSASYRNSGAQALGEARVSDNALVLTTTVESIEAFHEDFGRSTIDSSVPIANVKWEMTAVLPGGVECQEEMPVCKAESGFARSRDKTRRSDGCLQVQQHDLQFQRSFTKQMELLSRHAYRHPFLHKVWAFLEDQESSRAASIYAKSMGSITVLSALFTLTQSVETPLSDVYPVAVACVEVCFEFLFLVELGLHFSCSPSRCPFFCSPFNLIDLLAVVPPLVIRVCLGFTIPDVDVAESFAKFILLCYVPVFRLLKALRRFKKFHLLLTSFGLAFEALPVLLFVMAIITMVFSSLIYLVEPRDNIPTLVSAMWLTIVTMTTVGYGDVTPVSPAGNVIVATLVVGSVLYMAVPLALVGHAFTEIWVIRDEVLLMQRARDRIVSCGYTPAEIPLLFRTFNEESEGSLTLDNFRNMLEGMHLGLTEGRVCELFNLFDTDGSGTVSDHEFIRTLFPNQYSEIFSNLPTLSANSPNGSGRPSDATDIRQSGLSQPSTPITWMAREST